MTDENVKTPAVEDSPDYFAAPKKGKGVRRLNSKPLVVVGAIVTLAIGGVSYTYFDRVNSASQKAAVTEKPKVENTAKPPTKPDGDTYTPPVPPEAPVDPEAPTETPTPGQTDPVPPTQIEVQQSEAMTTRLRQIAQLQEARLTEFDQALKSPSKIDGNSPTGTGTQQTAAAGGRVDPQQLMQEYMRQSQMQGGGGNGAGGSSLMPQGGGGGTGMAAANGQTQKRAFLSASLDAETYLGRERKAALVPNVEIKAGTVIPGVMISGINSDLPGMIIGQVRQAVYDSATGQNLLIPPGARLVGTYDSGVTLGQTRALVVWQRLIYPDGSSLTLDNMTGADRSGYAGFNDKVNNHYAKLFGNAIFLSMFSAGIQLSQPQASNGENYSSSQIIAGALGQQLGQLGMKMAERNMDIQPTIEIRPGYQFNIMVNKDIILPPWEGHPLAQ